MNEITLESLKKRPDVEHVGGEFIHGSGPNRAVVAVLKGGVLSLTSVGKERLLSDKEAAKPLADEEEPLDVDQMGKPELVAYAQQHYGVELDKRKGVDNLRAMVKELDAGGTLPEQDEE